MKNHRAPIFIAVLVVMFGLIAAGCAGFQAGLDDMSRSLNGVGATATVYDESGDRTHRFKGISMDVAKNGDFDKFSSTGDGIVKTANSAVIQLSIGDDIVTHVGSTMVLAQDGLEPIAESWEVDVESIEPGRPWINHIRQSFRNNWTGGVAQTIVISSQQGTPIAVYSGDEVEIYDHEVTKSTRLDVDGKVLWIYRADYTIIPTSLLDAVGE